MIINISLINITFFNDINHFSTAPILSNLYRVNGNIMASKTTYAPLETAVLLVIFNRPETTRKVFEAIRKAQPKRLYISADGPRTHVPEDAENCEKARSIVNDEDWNCDVKTLFRKENVNCGRGPSSGFSWFFEHETEGIILEDDCLPSQSFFWFCQELLERYRDDKRIVHIGGNNFLEGWRHDKNADYYFSQNGHIWGWATWRRAWKYFDYDINNYEELKERGYFDHFFLNRLEKHYRLRKFDRTVANRGHVDWWDYQWDFARYTHNGLSIVPQKNLVKNLGFGENATHTTNSQVKSAFLEAEEIDFPLTHPKHIMRDIESDKRYFTKFMINNLQGRLKKLIPI